LSCPSLFFFLMLPPLPSTTLFPYTTLFRSYNHPYRNPVIGWRQELEQLGLEDAINFYEQYYTPNNATLIITGDVTPERVRELARSEEHTSELQSRENLVCRLLLEKKNNQRQ